MKARAVIPGQLLSLAGAQANVFTRQQVLACGASQALIERQLRLGEWLRLGQGVYTTEAKPSFDALCWAGLLLAQGPACVGGLAAAHLYGLAEPPARITIWGERSRTQGPWTFRRGMKEGMGSPRRLRVDDAILEACAESPRERLVGVLTDALRRRLTVLPRLRARAEALETLRHRHYILALLPQLEAGVESTLENHFLHQVLRPHRLPEGVRQVSVSDGTRSDIVLAEFAVIIELDGRRGHEGEAKWRDAIRDNRHALLGFVTLRFGWHDVVLRPCWVGSIIAGVLTNRGWKGATRGVHRCGRRCTADQVTSAAA